MSFRYDDNPWNRSIVNSIDNLPASNSIDDYIKSIHQIPYFPEYTSYGSNSTLAPITLNSDSFAPFSVSENNNVPDWILPESTESSNQLISTVSSLAPETLNTLAGSVKTDSSPKPVSTPDHTAAIMSTVSNVASLAGDAYTNLKDKDLSTYKNQDEEFANQNYVGSNDYLNSQRLSTGTLGMLSRSDAGYYDGGQRAAHALKMGAQGAAAGAAIGSFFPGGQIIGGVLGGAVGMATSAVTDFFHNNNAEKQQRLENRRRTLANDNNQMTAQTAAQYNDEKQLQKSMGNLNMYPVNMTAFGGDLDLNPDYDLTLTKFSNGGTHEENPYGGIPQGVDSQGNPNLVEEGEVKWNNYIFSNRLNALPILVDAIKLPKRYGNKTMSDIATDLYKEGAENPNDTIARETLEENLQRLQLLQEAEKQMKTKAENNLGYCFGGKLFAEGGDLEKYKDKNKIYWEGDIHDFRGNLTQSAHAPGAFTDIQMLTDNGFVYDRESNSYTNIPNEVERATLMNRASKNYGLAQDIALAAATAPALLMRGTASLKPVMKTLKPIFNNPAVETYFTYEGLKNLASGNGVQKTKRLYDKGDYVGAAKSAVGDVLDATGTAGFLNRARKVNQLVKAQQNLNELGIFPNSKLFNTTQNVVKSTIKKAKNLGKSILYDDYEPISEEAFNSLDNISRTEPINTEFELLDSDNSSNIIDEEIDRIAKVADKEKARSILNAEQKGTIVINSNQRNRLVNVIRTTDSNRLPVTTTTGKAKTTATNNSISDVETPNNPAEQKILSPKEQKRANKFKEQLQEIDENIKLQQAKIDQNPNSSFAKMRLEDLKAEKAKLLAKQQGKSYNNISDWRRVTGRRAGKVFNDVMALANPGSYTPTYFINNKVNIRPKAASSGAWTLIPTALGGLAGYLSNKQRDENGNIPWYYQVPGYIFGGAGYGLGKYLGATESELETPDASNVDTQTASKEKPISKETEKELSGSINPEKLSVEEDSGKEKPARKQVQQKAIINSGSSSSSNNSKLSDEEIERIKSGRAFGGNLFADGGNLFATGGGWDWNTTYKDNPTPMLDIIRNYSAKDRQGGNIYGKLDFIGTKEETNETQQDYQDFTNWVVDNWNSDEVKNYLSAIDASGWYGNGKYKDFRWVGPDGKVIDTPEAKEFYRRLRNDQAWGVHHFTPKRLVDNAPTSVSTTTTTGTDSAAPDIVVEVNPQNTNNSNSTIAYQTLDSTEKPWETNLRYIAPGYNALMTGITTAEPVDYSNIDLARPTRQIVPSESLYGDLVLNPLDRAYYFDRTEQQLNNTERRSTENAHTSAAILPTLVAGNTYRNSLGDILAKRKEINNSNREKLAKFYYDKSKDQAALDQSSAQTQASINNAYNQLMTSYAQLRQAEKDSHKAGALGYAQDAARALAEIGNDAYAKWLVSKNGSLLYGPEGDYKAALDSIHQLLNTIQKPAETSKKSSTKKSEKSKKYGGYLTINI